MPLQGVSRCFHLTRKKNPPPARGGRCAKRRCRDVQLGPTPARERGVYIKISRRGVSDVETVDEVWHFVVIRRPPTAYNACFAPPPARPFCPGSVCSPRDFAGLLRHPVEAPIQMRYMRDRSFPETTTNHPPLVNQDSR